MICPYCKKKISDNNQFCPECGQNLAIVSETDSANSFWETVNKEDSERHRKYKNITDRGIKNVRDRRHKTMVTVVILVAVVIVAIFGVIQFNNYRKEMASQVQAELIGKTFIAHDSHMEGLGWIYHEYWQLTFKDDTTLNYAYVETVGPREDDEEPQLQGTYSYSITQSIFGKYTISVNGEKFTLNVTEENMPKSISYGL